jgi:hypothetical protein
VDEPQETQITGKELMESGLLVSIKGRPGAALITYRRTEAHE